MLPRQGVVSEVIASGVCRGKTRSDPSRERPRACRTARSTCNREEEESEKVLLIVTTRRWKWQQSRTGTMETDGLVFVGFG